MGVINITITPSADGVIPGIPASIELSTSEPATIFYTLDKTSPNVFSPVYVVPIQIGSNITNLTLMVFATNGADSSAVITETYIGNPAGAASLDNVRVSHAQVFGLNNQNTTDLYPYGDNRPNSNVIYGNTSGTGTTVFNQSLPATSNGFDGKEQPAVFTNQPISSFDFKQRYSTSNYEGEVSPSTVSYANQSIVIGKSTPVEYNQEISKTSDKIFNPRAFVIIQDEETEDPTNPVLINRGYFSLPVVETDRDGELLQNVGLETASASGSFISRYYNPRTQTFSDFFRDNTNGRWIISTYPYAPTSKGNNLSQMVFGRSPHVYNWVFGLYKTLY